MDTDIYQSLIKEVTELARREAGRTGKLHFSRETAALLGVDDEECAASPAKPPNPEVVPVARKPKPTAKKAAPPAPVETAPSRGGLSEGALEGIGAEVRGCERCPLWRIRTNVGPGEGNPRAPLVFVGEAPGANEDRLGRPFV